MARGGSRGPFREVPAKFRDTPLPKIEYPRAGYSTGSSSYRGGEPYVDLESLVAHASIGAGVDGGATSAINTSDATLLVAIVASENTIGSSGVVSDSKSNVWTARTLAASGTTAYLRIFDCVAPIVGAGHTFTSTLVGGYPFLAVAAFKGTLVGGAFSKEGTSNVASGTSLANGSITPDYANALVVTGIACPRATTAPTCTLATISDASAIVALTNFSGGLAYIAQQPATAINPVWSWAPAEPGAAAIAVYLRG